MWSSALLVVLACASERPGLDGRLADLAPPIDTSTRPTYGSTHQADTAASTAGLSSEGDTGSSATVTTSGGSTSGPWYGLPDPWAVMDPNHCQAAGYYDAALPIAVSYFVGNVTVVHGGVAGTETWSLFFNAAAQSAMGVSECRVVWAVTGDEQATGMCDTCTFGMSLHAEVDVADTTCPRSLWEDALDFEVTYDVLADPSGLSTVFFATSGNVLGAWYWRGDRYTYLTPPGCVIL